MSLIGFIAAGKSTMWPPWLSLHQAFVVAHPMALLLQGQGWFWLQLMVVVGGTA